MSTFMLNILGFFKLLFFDQPSSIILGNSCYLVYMFPYKYIIMSIMTNLRLYSSNFFMYFSFSLVYVLQLIYLIQSSQCMVYYFSYIVSIGFILHYCMTCLSLALGLFLDLITVVLVLFPS